MFILIINHRHKTANTIHIQSTVTDRTGILIIYSKNMQRGILKEAGSAI